MPRPARPALLQALLQALLLALLAIAAHHGAFACGFVWDDDDYVTQNPVLREVSGIASIWLQPRSLPQYYPLVHSSFWLEYRLWGQDPLGYHIVNVLLHAASAVLLWRLLLRLALPGALLAAAWFAAHPVHVESVAWITERKNVLSLLCMLLAAHAFFTWRERGTPRRYALATLFFLMALASKTVTATLPGALLVLCWWQNGRIERRELRALLPWLALGAFAGWFTAHLEATHVGAAAMSDLHGVERILVAARAPWFYLGKLLLPVGLCFNYPRWNVDAGDVAQWAFVLATVAALLAALLLRKRLGRGPLATLLLFGGMLTPALGFFDVYPFRFSYVADHFQYHASLAVLAGVAAFATLQLRERLGRPIAIVLAAVSTLGLAAFSHCLTASYRDEATLWQATLRCNERSTLALTNLAGAALRAGDLTTAETLSQRALAVEPDNPESIANLGVIAHRNNDLPTAERCYERALALRPAFASTLRNLGALRHQQGRTEEALHLVERALELDPEFPDARSLHVTLLAALQRWPECLTAAEWMLRFTPDALDLRLRAAEAALHVAKYDAAATHAAHALRKVPVLEQAASLLARALAHDLARGPAERVRSDALAALQRLQVPEAAMLGRIRDELARQGAAAHAAALR